MKVTWICYLHRFTAMGVIAINVVKELTNLGIDVGLHALNKDEVNPQDYPPEIQEALKKGHRYDSIGIFFAYPDVYRECRCQINVGYTGADTNGWYRTQNEFTPEESCNNLEQYMLTPSDYSKRNMLKCGVKIPIELFPHGINIELFKPDSRTRPGYPFRFVYCGELSERKGTQDLIRTFIKLYGNNRDFELVLRANTHMQYYGGNDIKSLADSVCNVRVDWKNEGQEDLKSYYTSADCYVYPSKADWFGMTPFEALACGIPTIATNTNGYKEFLDGYFVHVAYDVREVGNQHPYLMGEWYPVSQLDLENSMKYVVDTYNEQKRLALKASEFIHNNFSWNNVTRKYLVPFLQEIDKVHFQKETEDMSKYIRMIAGYP